MALSRHFTHLRTQVPIQTALVMPIELPDTTNKFELRRNRAAIKIPKRLSGIIVKDKKELKPFATYFELKPLYYSSVIKNARHYYKDLAQYLNISENTLRQRIADMLRMDLAWWDGKDLRLVAYNKVCKKYKLTHYFHKINNIGDTEYNIRAISLKENLDDQQYVCNKKIIQNAIKQEIVENQLHKIKTLSNKNTIVSIPEMVKRIDVQNVEKTVRTSELKKIKRIVRLRIDVLTKQMQERTDNNIINGIKCSKTANPTTTLSCKSVAKMYGCSSASTGHYWEQNLASKKLINITPEFLEIKNNRSQLIWDKYINGENNGVWSPKHVNKKTGKKYYFLRLSNLISIINNPQTPLFI